MTRMEQLAMIAMAACALHAGAAAALDCSNDGGLAALREGRPAWVTWCGQCGGEVIEGPQCRPGPRWGQASAGSSGLIEKSLDYGARSGDLGGAALGVGTGLILESLKSPVIDANAERERLEAERARAVQRAAEREREAGESQSRILPHLKGLDESGTPGLKLDDSGEEVRDAVAQPRALKPRKVVNHACESEKDCMRRCACYWSSDQNCPKQPGETDIEHNRRCVAGHRDCANACR